MEREQAYRFEGTKVNTTRKARQEWCGTKWSRHPVLSRIFAGVGSGVSNAPSRGKAANHLQLPLHWRGALCSRVWFEPGNTRDADFEVRPTVPASTPSIMETERHNKEDSQGPPQNKELPENDTLLQGGERIPS